MRVHKKCIIASFAFAGLAVAVPAEAQRVPEQFTVSGNAAGRLYDYVSINSATAERLSDTCFDIIQREAGAESATIVILNSYGLVVDQHSKDGQQYTSIKITENKARTALLMRSPTIEITQAVEDDVQQLIRYDQIGGLAAQAGGVPIVVNGQLIGSMGIGGFGGGEGYHTVAMMCLDAVFGPQPQ